MQRAAFAEIDEPHVVGQYIEGVEHERDVVGVEFHIVVGTAAGAAVEKGRGEDVGIGDEDHVERGSVARGGFISRPCRPICVFGILCDVFAVGLFHRPSWLQLSRRLSFVGLFVVGFLCGIVFVFWAAGLAGDVGRDHVILDSWA